MDGLMNQTLAAFFARGGVEVIGTRTRTLPRTTSTRSRPATNALAYDLGRQAFR